MLSGQRETSVYFLPRHSAPRVCGRQRLTVLDDGRRFHWRSRSRSWSRRWNRRCGGGGGCDDDYRWWLCCRLCCFRAQSDKSSVAPGSWRRRRLVHNGRRCCRIHDDHEIGQCVSEHGVETRHLLLAKLGQIVLLRAERLDGLFAHQLAARDMLVFGYVQHKLIQLVVEGLDVRGFRVVVVVAVVASFGDFLARLQQELADALGQGAGQRGQRGRRRRRRQRRLSGDGRCRCCRRQWRQRANGRR